MSEVTVLDASAILAFLQGEPGEDVVRQALKNRALRGERHQPGGMDAH